jgi:hypothetical protein
VFRLLREELVAVQALEPLVLLEVVGVRRREQGRQEEVEEDMAGWVAVSRSLVQVVVEQVAQPWMLLAGQEAPVLM